MNSGSIWLANKVDSLNALLPPVVVADLPESLLRLRRAICLSAARRVRPTLLRDGRDGRADDQRVRSDGDDGHARP